MNKKKKLELPDNFFKIKRPTMSFKEALKDVEKINWVKKENTKKAI